MARSEMVEKLELAGQFFTIDGITDLLNDYKAGISMVKATGIVIQIAAIGIKKNPKLMDKLVAAHTEKTIKEVQEMPDNEYTVALKNAIMIDVFGFFG